MWGKHAKNLDISKVIHLTLGWWNWHNIYGVEIIIKGSHNFVNWREGDKILRGSSFERKSLYYLQRNNGLDNHVRAGWLPNMTISHENQNTFFLFIHAKSSYETFIQTVHSLFGRSWGQWEMAWYFVLTSRSLLNQRSKVMGCNSWSNNQLECWDSNKGWLWVGIWWHWLDTRPSCRCKLDEAKHKYKYPSSDVTQFPTPKGCHA